VVDNNKKIGHRSFVSVLAQIYRSIAKYGFRTLLHRMYMKSNAAVLQTADFALCSSV